jgi:hypothetical protein
MEFLFFLIILVIAVNVVRGLSREAQAQQQRLLEAQEAGGGENRVRAALAARAAAAARGTPPAGTGSDPWWTIDEPGDGGEAEASFEEVWHQVPSAGDDRGGMTVEVAARPVPAQPVALDGEVDRDAEHVRFHGKIEARPAAKVARVAKAPAGAGAGVLRSLRDSGTLRRAVLAAEVLGPPRALREHDR